MSALSGYVETVDDRAAMFSVGEVMDATSFECLLRRLHASSEALATPISSWIVPWPVRHSVDFGADPGLSNGFGLVSPQASPKLEELPVNIGLDVPMA
jgi:hypothetical protein